MDQIQTAYDQIPYNSVSFPQTHPDRLATVATLLGLDPPPIERCRVLELGCASGGNLLPMAQGLPGSEFVGLDLSGRQVSEGQKAIAALGLKNIVLLHQNLLEVEPDFGQFDYIIAHGVYSWVPPAVQAKLLDICRRNLRPNGVAYVSYNTYPGWRLHSTVRDMLLYHLQQVAEPAERISQARELIDFLAESILAEGNPHASFLHSYVNYVRERFLPDGDDAYLFHNELAEVNEPVYFHQFAERAAEHGLKYLGEAQFQTMLATNLPPKVAASLSRIARNTIALEQYMDFLRNRTFRQTLLCHQEVQLKGKLTPDRLAYFYMASSALPESPELDIFSTRVDKFRAPNGDTLATDHPITKAALFHLSRMWPQAVQFNDLLAAACRLLNINVPQDPLSPDRQILGANLLKGFTYNEDLVEFHVYAPHFTLEIGDRPVVSPVARYEARRGSRVTNLRHELVNLEGLPHSMFPYLDGSWNRAGLLRILEKWVAEGVLEVRQEDGGPMAANQLRDTLAEMLESTLRSLANAALLIS